MGLITNIDCAAILDNVKMYTHKVGRVTARPVLLLYYVMKSEKTSMKDKLIISGALAYILLPIDLLNARRLPIIGWGDEVVSLAVVIQQMHKYITNEMKAKADEQLDKWFEEYAKYDNVTEV